MIDRDGFRPNVGIILTNARGQVFWARRAGEDAWQFPQGGINADETPEQAMYRELKEEVGLTAEHVQLLGATQDWLKYRLPKQFIRRGRRPVCVGQKQIWFLLGLAPEAEQYVRFDTTDQPEFDGWKWVDYWQPSKQVVFFKRAVYRQALKELAPLRLAA